MMTGQSSELEFESRSEMIRQSRTATNLVISLSASNPEAYAQAVQTFDVLRDALEDQAAVLKILTAENLVRLNQLALAERTLREAAMAEPNLAIAFKNLGDIMRATGRSSLGWLCYEAFAVVSPNHPENRQIEEAKAVILRDFPEFF
jgi:tetratricopeptide (TPR) repeat protein